MGRSTDVISLDLFRAFDMVPQDIHISILVCCGCDGCTIQGIRKWLEGITQTGVQWLCVQLEAGDELYPSVVCPSTGTAYYLYQQHMQWDQMLPQQVQMTPRCLVHLIHQ